MKRTWSLRRCRVEEREVLEKIFIGLAWITADCGIIYYDEEDRKVSADKRR